MKGLTLLFIAAIACSCNNTTTTAKGGNSDTTISKTTPESGTVPDYPYKIEHPDNWEVGSSANTMVVLKALKAWEENKMDESLAYFADSVVVKFDALDKKMSNDSLKAFLGAGRNSFKTVNERVSDWESVISKDKSEEWVTIWYTQSWEEKNGAKDSSAVINDLKLKNGKITRIDEYTRKLH